MILIRDLFTPMDSPCHCAANVAHWSLCSWDAEGKAERKKKKEDDDEEDLLSGNCFSLENFFFM